MAIRFAIVKATISFDNKYPCVAQVKDYQEWFYNQLADRLGRHLVVRPPQQLFGDSKNGKKYSLFITRKPKETYRYSYFIDRKTTAAPSDDPAYAAISIVLDDPDTVVAKLSELLSDENREWISIALPEEFNDEKRFNEIMSFLN